MKIRKVTRREPNLSVAEKKFLANKDRFGKRQDVIDAIGELDILTDHEPITFNMHGLRYTCDFVAVSRDTSELTIVEIKGSKFQRGYYYTRARMIAASMTMPLFNFIIVQVNQKKSAEEWEWKIL